MSSEQKPRIFISHRFDDKPIADVIRRTLARWSSTVTTPAFKFRAMLTGEGNDVVELAKA
jgi:hypothetical protein